jgi:hypothetical protein
MGREVVDRSGESGCEDSAGPGCSLIKTVWRGVAYRGCRRSSGIG